VAFDGTSEERRLSLGQTYTLADIPAAVAALTQRRPIQMRVDGAQLDPHLQAQLETHRVKAVLLLPMVIGDRVLGFAQVWESSTPRHFTESEIAMGQTLVHQATITIDNARLVEMLRQRTIELQSRNEELDAFAHTVAHDLKNPLNSLIGFAYFLEQRFTEMSDEDMLGDLRMIVQSGQKINTIIDELLILASVRQMEKVEIEPLDMASIVADAQKRLTGMIAEHQAEVVATDDWPVALGRGQWVEEVWVNYVSNALKYGGRPPWVELGAAEQEDGTVRFWVRDNGPGLTLEEKTQLFVPFTRLDQARAKGHGLGLSIVRRIVEKMGGQVGVESEIGQGSTFFFTLPSASQ
jgi:signal transduction histidine kinase